MSAARVRDLDDQDSTAGSEPAPQQARTRRTLLGAAAGGFALAASGLFLPTIEDGEAREGANGGMLGGRRGKDRRGRRHRRTHGDHKGKKGKDNGAPGALVDGIRWGYYSEAGAFDVEFWGRADGKVSQHVPNEHFVELRVDDVVGILWINHRYFLSAENVFGRMKLWMGYGGSFSSTRGWVDGTTVFSDYLKEGQLAPDMVVDGFKFTVERIPDDDDYKKPSLSIRKQ